MLEVEGRASEIVREDLILRRFGPEGEAPVRFEVVIPSDVPEAELVAAKAVRQMAENAKMGPDEADRLQLAVIEACINAMEHSGSHEKKVFLTCTVKDGRIEVSVESQGGKSFELGGQAEEQEDGGPPRMRGYGLKLIGGYTDGLKVERAGSRARLVLLKNIK
jgi:anti-sigma regulatory factor (Ser/Thr protein kinase)